MTSTPTTTTSELSKKEVRIVEIRSNLLEKILTRRLILEEEEDDNDNDEVEEEPIRAIQYGIRYDAHWLKCYQPKWKLMTILGLVEDDHPDDDDDDGDIADDFINWL